MPVDSKVGPPVLEVGVVPPPGHRLPADPGAEEMFSVLYEELYGHAIDHAERYFDPDDASDVVAKALFELWWNWAKLTPERRTAAYILGAVHNHILTRLSEQAHDQATEVDIDDADAELTQMAIGAMNDSASLGPDEVVDMVVRRMPPKRRAAYLLVREARLPYKEAAAQLGISEGTLNGHMLAAGKAVREALQRKGFRILSRTEQRALKPGNTFMLVSGSKEANDE